MKEITGTETKFPSLVRVGKIKQAYFEIQNNEKDAVKLDEHPKGLKRNSHEG